MQVGIKPLRILLSAYACEPGKGSEPGVGWNWALALVRRGHEVWVLTRCNNRAAIEHTLANGNLSDLKKLHFIYYDVPKWMSWWKKGGRGVHFYYFLWQWGAYFLAKKWHREIKFELVHHVTFVSVRQPSFMGNLGIPFIFGPVAGGESTPWRLRKNFGLRGWMTDAIRDLTNLMVCYDPFMLMTFSQARHIYATSEQTRKLITQRYQEKTSVQLAIALEQKNTYELAEGEFSKINKSSVRLLYVGNFLDLKGMQLGMPAFAKLLKVTPNARLTMVGKGPDEAFWRHMAKQIGIDKQIDWVPWVRQSELVQIYCSHDVMLFPSLRDSGGMVVLEAMSHGLPVVCLKLGGPGVLVDDSCGRAVDVAGTDVETAISKLAEALIELAASPVLRKSLGVGAQHKAKELTWDAAVSSIYRPVEQEWIRK